MRVAGRILVAQVGLCLHDHSAQYSTIAAMLDDLTQQIARYLGCWPGVEASYQRDGRLRTMYMSVRSKRHRRVELEERWCA